MKIIVLGTEVKELEGEGDNWLVLVTKAHGATVMTLGPSWRTWQSPLSSLHGPVRVRVSITCDKSDAGSVVSFPPGPPTDCHYPAVGWRAGARSSTSQQCCF